VFNPLPHHCGRGRVKVAVVVLAAGFCLVAATAADAPPAPSTPPPAIAAATNGTASTDSAPNDLGDLEQFLSLSPERITQLRKALDYLDNMSQAQREALLRDVKAWQFNVRQLRQEIKPDQQVLTRSEQFILNRYEAMLSPEDLHALFTRFHGVAADQAKRQSIIQEMLQAAADNGIKAPPPNPPRMNATGNGPHGTTPGRGQNPLDNGHDTPPSPSAGTAASQ
jgi:hypothetical protein